MYIFELLVIVKDVNMTFDLNLLAEYAVRQISEFADSHQDETFYAFAIDQTMMCLNSEEAFESEVDRLEKRYPGHGREKAERYRMNTGDWDYQGFAVLEGPGRFPFGDTGNPEFIAAHRSAMNDLLMQLNRLNAFDCLRCSDEFVAFVAGDD